MQKKEKMNKYLITCLDSIGEKCFISLVGKSLTDLDRQIKLKKITNIIKIEIEELK